MSIVYILLGLNAALSFVAISIALKILKKPQGSAEDGIKELKGAFETFDRYSRE